MPSSPSFVRTLGTIIWAAASLLAQAQGTTPPGNVAAPAPLLVRFNVVVLDAKGQPVSDLTPADLKVTDQARPETITFFRWNGTAAAPAPAPHEYTNRPGGVWPHSTVILFDLMSAEQNDRLTAWHKLGRSLQELPAGDGLYFYLLSLEGTLIPIHPIGGTAGDDHTWPQQVEKTLDKAMKGASHSRPTGMSDEDVVKKTDVALETLANQLAKFPGRRDIIWITSRVSNVYPQTQCNGDWIDCALYVPHLSVTIDRDNVAVNPLSYSSSQDPATTRDIEQFAGLTGGRAYFAEDIRAVIDQVSRDSANSYTIIYGPDDTPDSKFHKIRVTCERKGVKLQAKQRYYSYPDSKTAQAKQQAALVAAFQSPADLPDIGLRMTVTPAASGPKAAHLEIRINPADLMMREELGHYNDEMTFVLADLTANGPNGEPSVSSFSLNFTKEQREAVMKDGIPISQDHALNEATRKIRILLLDQATNAVGSLTVPVSAAGADNK